MTDRVLLEAIKPRPSNPYYIVSPPYTRTSAGVTVLHVLCHYLNIAGRNAYIVHHPQGSQPIERLPPGGRLQQVGEFPAGMVAPFITQQVVEAYADLRLTPIVVYPEVFDNVFEAYFFVRYLLNYPGLLGPKPIQTPDVIIAYSQRLADHVGADEVLYICTADLAYWNTSGAASVRSGTCYYGGKTKGLLKADLRDAPKGSIEIESVNMSRDEIRRLFWQSEAFYCFEDTALATEAQLCGCPVVFVPTKYFDGIQLARAELGDDGACLIGEPGGLDRAQRTVHSREAHIRATFAKVPHRIAELAAKIEALVSERPYQGTINLPLKPRLVYFAPPAPAGAATRDGGEQDASSPPVEVDLASMHAELASVHADLTFVHADMAVARETAERLGQEIETLRTSLSWRVTAPLRAVLDWLQSLPRPRAR